MTRTGKIIDFYAHDYRDMTLSEADLREILIQVVECLNCKHECNSGDKHYGCNCDCGEFHISE
jgi:hypothetical protein